MKQSGVVQSLVIAGVLALGGCGKKEAGPAPSSSGTASKLDTVPVTTLLIQPKTFVEYGEYYGAVAGIKEANLICYSGGKVEKIMVKEGVVVKEGDALAHIDAEKATTLLEMAVLNEKIALENYQQAQKNLSDGTMSQLSVNQLNLAYLNAKQQRIDAKRNRDGALCVAPFSGIVTARRLELYQDVAPGTPTFTIAQIRQMKVAVNIPEGEILGVKEGNKATVYFSAIPDTHFTGTVYRVTRGISDMTKTFSAEIHMDNGKGLIKPGFTARVVLARQTLTEQIVVPTKAILSNNEGNYLVIADGGRASMAHVVLGPSNDTESVIAKGLSPAARLVIEGNHLVVSGSPLKVTAEN